MAHFHRFMKFKIHCNYSTTGGPQSLHQVCKALIDHGHEALMCYPPVGEGVVPLWSKIYGLTAWESRTNMRDEAGSVVVLPAGWGPNWYPMHPKQYSCIHPLGPETYRSVKVMWWLGLGTWQDWDIGGWDVDSNLSHPNVRRLYHACQSQLAYEYLKGSGLVPMEQVFMLRDYTHEFFHVDECELIRSEAARQNVVLYNAAKGAENHRRIIEACSGLPVEFVAISGMSRESMRDLALRSKVYMDFGHHPGRDRIPREMAACGLSVITGCDGTASLEEDLPVGRRKFWRVDGEYDFAAIRGQIELDINDWLRAFADEDMQAYRRRIRREKKVVYDDVANMVDVIDYDIKARTVPCWRDLPKE